MLSIYLPITLPCDLAITALVAMNTARIRGYPIEKAFLFSGVMIVLASSRDRIVTFGSGIILASTIARTHDTSYNEYRSDSQSVHLCSGCFQLCLLLPAIECKISRLVIVS